VIIPMPQRISIANFYDYGAQPDSATVLAHAFGDVSGALLDFKSQILRAHTSGQAIEIQRLLAELIAKAVALEDLALKTAEELNHGSAA
jgi:hypothetical protein